MTSLGLGKYALSICSFAQYRHVNQYLSFNILRYQSINYIVIFYEHDDKSVEHLMRQFNKGIQSKLFGIISVKTFKINI